MKIFKIWHAMPNQLAKENKKFMYVDVEKSELSPQILLQGDRLFTEFKSAFTENFVAQELKASGHLSLFYWTSAGAAEIDFLLSLENEILPLEVKSGTSTKKKSLRVYANKYQPSTLVRASLMNLKKNKGICNYPLYMVSCILRCNGYIKMRKTISS